MNELKVLVVEDEMVIAMDLCDKLEELGYQVLDPVSSVAEALACLENETPDIAIQLEGKKTGIDLGRILREQNKIPFIYLTSNTDQRTVEDAKVTLPYAFLRKPFQLDDLHNAIEIAVYSFQSQKADVGPRPKSVIRDTIFVKTKNHFEKIALKDIVYLKADHVYVEVYTADDKRFLLRDTLSDFLETLPSHYVRVHRSYGANIDHIKTVDNHELTMTNKERVPISKTYKEGLMQLLGIE
jgi:two-component system response regulator LytT